MTPEEAEWQRIIVEAVKAAREEAYEEAARACDGLTNREDGWRLDPDYFQGTQDCAAAIRALKNRDALQADIDEAQRTNPEGSILD